MRPVTAALCLLLVTAGLLPAQQATGSARGTVRDGAGMPLAGAEVVIGRRSAVTNPLGAFVVDSLAPGRLPVTVRMIGYTPVREELEIRAGSVATRDFQLLQAGVVLPTVVVDGSRPGIYGTVGILAERPAPGARVQLVGPGGRVVTTDSSGRFAFPGLDRGLYLVRVTLAGFTERRVSVALERDAGQELAINLLPSTRVASRGDVAAMDDLEKRLAFGLRDDRLSPVELRRHGRGDLCDLPRLKAALGDDNRLTTVIVNGVTIYRELPVYAICAWQADEVEMVEFGASICSDRTGTIANLLGAWCGAGAGRRFAPVTSLSRGGGRMIGTPARGGFVVIWERR